MKRLDFLFLILILTVGFAVRLYRFNGPVADWHSWRQADTSAVSYFFTKNNFDILHPKYFDISNVQSGLDNPQGYRMVEFPLYNIFQAGLFTIFGHFNLEEWGRIVTIVMSIFSTIFIFLLGKRFGNWKVGLFAAGFFALVPYNIFYSRVILPDPSMVMATLGAIYFFSLWTEEINSEKLKVKSWLWFVLSLIFMSAALLFKPYAIFFIFPILYLVWNKWKLKLFLNWPLYLYALFALIPLVLWRIWILKFPEGIPASAWLFNKNNIRFTGAYFYWLFAERISKLILGYWGLPVIILGFLTKRKNIGFFLSFVISSLLYLIVIAGGNVQHDYYQILIIPSLALVFGLGADAILSTEYINKVVGLAVITVSILFMLAFGWYQVRDYFNINNPALITAGIAVQENTPLEAKIIAPYGGDTTLLYAAKRQGWPSFETDLSGLIKKGADYYLIVSPSAADISLKTKYQLVASSSDYLLFNLHQKP